MLPYNFEYYRPETAAEAVRLFAELAEQGKSPMYYGGGTEIITLGRLSMVKPGAVVDIKMIPECQTLGFQQDDLVLGAGLTLTRVEEANSFPLLSQTISEIADRTARNKITLGGNLCGQIIYREAVLPFLLTDSRVALAGRNGIRQVPILEAFKGTLQLERGEFLLRLQTPRTDLALPFVSIKIRQQWETGYPLITAAALRKDNRIRAAFSGLCPFPIRSAELEEALNDQSVPVETRLDRAVQRVPSPILNDVEGSSEYRLFVLRNLLADIMTNLGGI